MTRSSIFGSNNRNINEIKFQVWFMTQWKENRKPINGELYVYKQKYNAQTKKFSDHVDPMSGLPNRNAIDNKKTISEKLDQYWLDTCVPIHTDEEARRAVLELLKGNRSDLTALMEAVA